MVTEQERFWQGEFGTEYHKRNVGRVESNHYFFERIFDALEIYPGSVLEFGAGIGENLVAIKQLLPDAEMIAVEINDDAVASLQANNSVRATIQCSILDFKPEVTADLVLTKGLLVHIAPEYLPKAYQVLHATTRDWLLICEYYCPKPREIEYRGNTGKLWARDFAGELLDTYKDLELVNCGFAYHRDTFPQDDLTYFLMRKTNG